MDFDISEHADEVEYSSRKNKALNIFWAGITLYTVAYAAAATSDSNSIYRKIELLAIFIFIPASFPLISITRIKNPYLKMLFFPFLAWMVYILISGFVFDSTFAVFIFLVAFATSVFTYLTPFVLLLPQNLFAYKKIFNVITFFCIAYILLDIIFIRTLLKPDQGSALSQNAVESFTLNLGLPVGFLLLTYRYHSSGQKLLSVITIILSLLFSIIGARRGLILMCSLTAVFAYLLYLHSSYQKIAVLFFSVIVGFLLFMYGYNAYNKGKGGIFAFLIERGTEDTRTKVEDCYYADMKEKEWITGKGLNGSYFCPDIDENDTTGYRTVIETGYLQIILNSGLLSLCILFLLSIPAIFLGLFYSQNVLSKAAAIWILMWLISLYPSSILGLSMNHILFWVSTGICYSRKIRNIPESWMRDFFHDPEGHIKALSYENDN